MISGKLLTAAYALILAIPPAIALGFGGGHGHEHEEANFALDLGLAFALEGATILMLQPILAARFKWIERPFGQDMLIRFHRNMAVLAALLLVLHPVLVAAGENAWFLLYSLNVPWYVWAGKIALILLILNAIFSLGFKWMPFSFEKWRLGHDVIGPVLLAVILIHALVIGPDVRNTPLIWVFPLFFVIAASVFLWHRILRPSLLSDKPWTVTEVSPETDDVCTIKLVPPPGHGFRHLPGQFHFITLKRGSDLPEEEHHFTISSAPEPNGAVTSTIRNIGDFTATICDTKPGDSARVHGPFGRFSNTLHPEEKRVVFIAGGIGITPVMSMLRHMRDVGWPKPALLIYANSSRDKIVFREEIDAMHENINGFKAVHVLSRPDDGWQGETGHVDRELIERHAAPFTPDTGWYLCGPQGLIESAISDLKALGVPEKRMHREIFRFI